MTDPQCDMEEEEIREAFNLLVDGKTEATAKDIESGLVELGVSPGKAHERAGKLLPDQKSMSVNTFVLGVKEAQSTPTRWLLENDVPTNQVGECDPATLVVLHSPGLEVWLGSLHPAGNLFEKATTESTAQEAHHRFKEALEEWGATVLTVPQLLKRLPLRRIRTLAVASLSYIFSGEVSALTPDQTRLLSHAYKEAVVGAMSRPELLQTILLRPQVTLEAVPGSPTPLVVTTTTLRGSNLIFTRDQQIVTAKGLIIGRMSTSQRSPETQIMREVWQSLGVPIIHEVKEPHTLEGGDFIPVSEDLCLLGVGPRTNMSAFEDLLEKDLFGTRRVVAVQDLFDRHQDRMHLDTYFNIVDGELCVMLEDIIGEASPQRRLIREYVKVGAAYTLNIATRDQEFSTYIQREGFTIIPVTNEQQLKYMINFLNMGLDAEGNGRIISVHPDLADVLSQHGYHGQCRYIDYDAITAMYGAAHCSSQVLRTPRPPT